MASVERQGDDDIKKRLNKTFENRLDLDRVRFCTGTVMTNFSLCCCLQFRKLWMLSPIYRPSSPTTHCRHDEIYAVKLSSGVWRSTRISCWHSRK